MIFFSCPKFYIFALEEKEGGQMIDSLNNKRPVDIMKYH